MAHTIMEQINGLIEKAGGDPTGVGGSIVDKLDQLIVARGGEAHPAETIQEKVKKLSEMEDEQESGL